MSPQEIEKLLGGYATDTLSEEERRTLFAAALENQALFDALADEQALRELLQDGPSRAHLLAALGEEPVSLRARIAAWLRRPSVLALAAAVAAGIVTVAVVIPRKTALVRPAMVAMSKPPQAAQAPLQPAPEGTPEPKREVAAAEPSKDLRRARAAKKEMPERDAVVAQNGPVATNAVATTPPAEKPAPPPVPAAATPAPPPPPPIAAPPQPQSTETVEVQAAQAKLADTMRPAGAAGYRMEAGKVAAVTGARDLYYAVRPSAVSGFVDQPRAAKAKRQSFGLGSGVVGGVPAPAPARAGGVRYSILKRNGDGSFAEVDPATVFAAGDALRVRFETNQAGNLGVMERQSTGLWTLRLGARMQPGEAVHMPSESTINVRAPGIMRFFVRFSRSLRSEPNLDRIAPTPNLLRENAANSVYVVNPAWTPEAVVDFEMTINAK